MIINLLIAGPALGREQISARVCSRTVHRSDAARSNPISEPAARGRADLDGRELRNSDSDAIAANDHLACARPEQLVRPRAGDDFKTVLDLVFVPNPPSGRIAELEKVLRSGRVLIESVSGPTASSETSNVILNTHFPNKESRRVRSFS
ncbi:MAG: hypothetical protein JSV91_06780 [Phycisphaerales bacterium]|nr:MAG: hypothetical protein JSV91_06780 [Phycisphaerales bacterium]